MIGVTREWVIPPLLHLRHHKYIKLVSRWRVCSDSLMLKHSFRDDEVLGSIPGSSTFIFMFDKSSNMGFKPPEEVIAILHLVL